MKKTIWQEYGLAMILATLTLAILLFLLFHGFTLTSKTKEFELPNFIQAKMVVMPKKFAEEAQVKATQAPKEADKPKPTAAPKPDKPADKPVVKEETKQVTANIAANTDKPAEIAVKKAPEATKKPQPKATPKPTAKPTPKPTAKPTPKPVTQIDDILSLLDAPKPTQVVANSGTSNAAEDIGSYSDSIRQAIEFRWSFPPMYDPSAKVPVEVRLLPSGEIAAVNIAQSSGDRALDRSVLDAITLAAPFDVPKGALFDKNFRNNTFTFSPKDKVR